VNGDVETTLGEKIREFLLEHPQQARSIVAKVV
jgi:hypothetical protein